MSARMAAVDCSGGTVFFSVASYVVSLLESCGSSFIRIKDHTGLPEGSLNPSVLMPNTTHNVIKSTMI